MENRKVNKDVPQAASAPPFGWLERQLSRRAREVKFLRDQVFPYPVQPWEPAQLMKGPLFAKDAVTVPVFGKEERTCSFYVTQSFRLIRQKLFGGLQPDSSCFPDGTAMRVCLCITPEEEIETPIVLTDAGEFQLIVDLEPELAAQWSESSKNWASDPRSIPFGLVLRPLRGRVGE